MTKKSKSSNTKCVTCGKNKPLVGATRCRTCQQRVNKRQKELREIRKKQGLCSCGRKPPREGLQTCELCYAEASKAKNVTQRRRVQEGLCRCGSQPSPGKKSCEPCRLHDKRKHERLRRKVFEHYGLICACCGETMYEFLEIDHIDGDGKGNDHRRQLTAGTYRWLIQNNFPPGFQTLCSNCNRAKFRYGQCPHQKSKTT